MAYAEAGRVLWNVGEQKFNMGSDLEFFFRGIVENIEGDFVTQPFAAQKILRGNFRENLI
jgi:hypothetical protein